MTRLRAPSLCLAAALLACAGTSSAMAAPAGVVPGVTSTITGTLEVVHADDFNRSVGHTWYYVRTAGGRIPVDFPGNGPGLLTGSTVTIPGYQVGGRFAALSTDHLHVVRAQTAVAPGVKRTVVILFNFASDTRTPDTADSIRSTVFTAPNSVNAYYKETSFGKTSLTGKVRADGDVFGWYTISDSNAACDFNNNLTKWVADADQAATAAGHDLTGYDDHVYYFPSQRACGFAGMGYIGGPTTWINGYNAVPAFAHEIGHNYGVHHASGYECFGATAGQLVPYSTNCWFNGDTNSHPQLEYADPFDVMGNGWNGTHEMNAFHKAQLNFILPASIKTVTAPGTYTILPEELGGVGSSLLRIPNPKSRDPSGVKQFFYLDFRQQHGLFDNFNPADPAIGGVMVRLGTDLVANPSQPWDVHQSWLINAHPGKDMYGNETFTNAAFRPGETFSDPSTGIAVKVNSVVSSGATVTVSLSGQAPACVHLRPGVVIAPPSTSGTRVAGHDYMVTIKNNDPAICGAGTFALASVLPPGWTQSLKPGSVSPVIIGAGLSRVLSVHVTPAPTAATIAPANLFHFTEKVTNTRAPAFMGTGTASYTVTG